MIRALFASIILIQIRPQHVTNYIIEPFLQFGAIYTNSITSVVLPSAGTAQTGCEVNLDGYMSNASCEFLMQPLNDISRVNNTIIRRGLDLLLGGLGTFTYAAVFTTMSAAIVVTAPILTPVVVPLYYLGVGDSWGRALLNIITGIVLIATFFSFNLFTAFMIIQGIFKLGVALILYPFRVMVFVMNKSDKWIDPWAVFKEIIEALKKLVIAMIAVSFILIVNVLVAAALFNFDFTESAGLGAHSVTWVGAIMSFWVMSEVFKVTRKKLDEYVNDDDMSGAYEKIKKGFFGATGAVYGYGKKAIDIIRKKGP